MLARLVFRIDRALVAGSLGTAAAILLPVVGILILAGLAPTLDGAWVAYADDGSELRWQDASLAPDWVVARSLADPNRMAYLVGGPDLTANGTLAMPEASAPAGTPRSAVVLDGLGPRTLLVHPDALGPSTPWLAGFARPGHVPGAHDAPSRGSDAFEAATTRSLRDQSGVLVAASVPAVALLASAFARQEIRARARSSATLHALGGTRAAFLVLAGRVTLAVALGAVVAVVAGYALHERGGVLDPPDAPEPLLALAFAVPAAVAWGTGLAWAAVAARRLDVLKVGGAGGEDDVAVRVPLEARPLLLGLRPLAFLAVAALLFVVDVGFPLAAARVPASLAGGDDEWVFGAEEGLHVGNGVPATVATVAGLDPRVGAVVAETVNPTLLDGRAVVVRGGEWAQLDEYHRFGRLDGDEPRGSEVVLGARAAARLDRGLGDVVRVQGSDRADLVALRVVGIVDAPGLLADEAFVDEPLGRRLADLPPGQATLLRVRPDTQGALDALAQTAPNLVVDGLAIRPDDPPAGSLAHADITVANLGSTAGQKRLTLRIGGEAVGHLDAVVPGHARRTVSMPFVVPSGAWQADVNPSADGDGGPGERAWSVPSQAVANASFEATLTAGGQPAPGVDVALYRGLAAASAGQATQADRTDTDGHVRFTAPAPGDWVVGTIGEPRAFARIDVVSANATGLVVEAVWTEPALPRAGEQNKLFGQVRNPGSAPATGLVGAFAGTLRYADVNLTLQPGEVRVLSFVLYFADPVDSVGVGDLKLPLRAQAVPAPPPAAPGEPAPATPEPAQPGQASPGATAQREVADRALGDARAILVGLATSAIATTLAVATLVTQRTLAGRQHVIGLLRVLGQGPDEVRQRAAAEGALLGAVAALAALLPGKLLFLALGAFGPAVFAHGLPDPVGWLFALQTTAAFSGVCALAAYFGAARAVGPAR